MTDVLQGIRTATVNTEARSMLQYLSGAECSRLFACELADYRPHGAPDTWRKSHAERTIEELKAHWTVACIWRKVRPCSQLWMGVAEGGYQRAGEEQQASEVNSYGETILLQDKIAFWRANIPAAAGFPAPAPNLVELQRTLQLGWYAADGVAPPAVLQNNLVGWRQADLHAWTAANPGHSMSSP